jgi:hypothetical protein
MDRITLTSVVGFVGASLGTVVVQRVLHWNDWSNLGHLMVWLILSTVWIVCGIFFLVQTWPQVRPTFRRWLGLEEDAR